MCKKQQKKQNSYTLLLSPRYGANHLIIRVACGGTTHRVLRPGAKFAKGFRVISRAQYRLRGILRQ